MTNWMVRVFDVRVYMLAACVATAATVAAAEYDTADGGAYGSTDTGARNESGDLSNTEWSFGGTLRLRYERWRNGDIVPDSGNPLGPRSSAWRDGYNDDYLLTNLKLHVDAQFTEMWRGFAEVEFATVESNGKIDGQRRYEAKPHFQQLFIEYDDSVNRLVLGRQELDYGSRLVIGTNSWFNNTISYDLVRYDYTGEHIEASLFGGYEVFESNDDNVEPDNLVGGYHIARNVSAWRLEHYTFFKDHDRKNGVSDAEVYSIGVRAKRAWDRIDVDVDGIQQVGDSDGYASHGFLSWYPMPGHWSQIRLFTSYNVASGGRSPEDNYLAFAPAGHLDRQSTDFAPYINLKEYGVGVTLNPIKDRPFFVRLSWFDMYKFDRAGGIYSFDGNNLVWGSKTRSNHLGQNVALFATYELARTQTRITTCFTKYFIEDAIDAFPNRDDTNFWYLTIAQSF